MSPAPRLKSVASRPVAVFFRTVLALDARWEPTSSSRVWDAAQHEGDAAAFLPQADPRKHQANHRRRWRKHKEYIDDVVQELWRCHGFLEFAAVFRQAAGALLPGAPTAC